MAPGRNPNQATLVGGQRSHHCAIQAPALLKTKQVEFAKENIPNIRYMDIASSVRENSPPGPQKIQINECF